MRTSLFFRQAGPQKKDLPYIPSNHILNRRYFQHQLFIFSKSFFQRDRGFFFAGFPWDRKQFFKYQSCAKPVRGIIQPDQSTDIAGRRTVVPGTGIVTFQQTSGQIFTREDSAGIYAAPEENIFPFQNPAYGSKKACHTIDGEHPDGSVGCQRMFFVLQGAKSCKYDFHAPAQSAA